MGTRTAVLAGLAAGVLAGAALLAAAVLADLPGTGAGPTATDATPGGRATWVPVASSPAPSAAAAPVPSAGDGLPGASAVAAAFGVGRPAPPLRLATTAGGTVDLADLRGRPVWLVFMATWCPSCRDELPQMTRFSLRHEADGLAVIAVDVREDAASVAAYAAEVGVTFPVALDTDGAAQRAWGAWGLPVHLWIDREGVIRAGALGGIGPDAMAEALRTVMPGVTVEP